MSAERTQAARERMELAKAQLTAAARAALSGDPRAQEIAAQALREIGDASATLRAASERTGINDALLDALRDRFIGRDGER